MSQASDILYSLSDYYPGLPYEADIVQDNETLGFPIYRIYETVFFQDHGPPIADNVPDEDKPRKRVDVPREQSRALLAWGFFPT